MASYESATYALAAIVVLFSAILVMMMAAWGDTQVTLDEALNMLDEAGDG